MSRYIDADELIFVGFDNPDDDNLFEFVPKEFIDNAPTADVVPYSIEDGKITIDLSGIIDKIQGCAIKVYFAKSGADKIGGQDELHK